MALPADFRIDRGAVRRNAERRAASYDTAAVVARESAARMAERLPLIKLAPRRILDLGCGTGADLPLLAQHYPHAERIGLDLSPAMLRLAGGTGSRLARLLGRLRPSGPRLLCADAEALPLARASVQMVWSNLMLNWLHDPMPALREAHRVLEVGGLLMFASLGPDTLRELRAALPAGRGERVHRFIDMHDLGDALVGAGFADPVMDMQMLTLTYADLPALCADLRQAGASNAASARPRGLTGRADWARARSAYERLRQDARLPASFELVFGHAWKSAPRKTAEGHAIVQFEPRRGR